MNDLLPILTWLSLWAAVIVFGFMMVLYLFLMLMGKEELTELRQESDGLIQEIREAEATEKTEKAKRREERRRNLPKDD